MLPFFALGKTRFVLYFRVLALAVFIVWDFILFGLFEEYGLAAAMPISLLSTLFVWMLALSRELSGFDSGFYSYLLKLVAVLVVVGTVLLSISSRYDVGRRPSDLILLSGALSFGGCVLFGVLGTGLGLIPLRSLTGFARGLLHVKASNDGV
jgi:peptidoglycan biosynthesis protein MviN/MurJ (putative lipid II flippase)